MSLCLIYLHIQSNVAKLKTYSVYNMEQTEKTATPIFMLSTNFNTVSFVENNHISFTLSLLISITFLTECNVINFMEAKTNYFLING